MQTDIQLQPLIKNDIIIFEFNGELDETNTDRVFSDVHKEISVSGLKKVIFDFTKLKYLNSKAIWYVADTFSIIQDKEWEFVICGMNEAVAMVADIVWLQSIVKMYDNREEALKWI